MPFSVRLIPAIGLVLFSWSLAAQNLAPLPLSNLRQLTRSSGYIFDGTVLSVERDAQTEPGGVATVQVTFRVEQAIRGTRNRDTLTIREWAGLWTAGERYRPGERLLLFFYSPGKLGLTSPVGGPLGRMEVDSGGSVVLENERLAALSLNPGLLAPVRGKRRVTTRALALAIQTAGSE